MIAGLEDITSGTLKIGDKVMNDVDPKDRDIAMVFQNYALYPHMTVYDNMAFVRFRRMRSTRRSETQPRSLIWSICWTVSRRLCPVVRDSV